MSYLRKCNECGVEAHTEEELEMFSKNSQSKYGRANICKVCQNKKWTDRSKEWKAKHRYKNRYNITLEEYNKRMATSDHCQICGSKDNLVYDHCHDTMEFRGVLCRQCNRGLGFLGDTKEAIEKALEYLKDKR
jgi:hypothetical protein